MSDQAAISTSRRVNRIVIGAAIALVVASAVGIWLGVSCEKKPFLDKTNTIATGRTFDDAPPRTERAVQTRVLEGFA